MKIKNKHEILEALKAKGTTECIALAYLINEWIPDDRTTKFVFRNKTIIKKP